MEKKRMSRGAVCIQKVVRGFLAKRRVKRLLRVSAKEQDLMTSLLELVPVLNETSLEIQETMIAKDMAIPSAFFQSRSLLARNVVDNTSPTPNQVNKQVENGRTTSEIESESDSEVSEDESKPVNTTDHMFGRTGTRQASIRWFQATQVKSVKVPDGSFADWFHGIITRRHSEDLLMRMPVGYFLIRVSESRFGYTLSFRVSDRCRHYMIDLLPNKKFIVIGETKVHDSLHELVLHYQKNRLSNWDFLLTQACSQIQGQCDYAELVYEDEELYSEVNEPIALEKMFTDAPNPALKSPVYLDLDYDLVKQEQQLATHKQEKRLYPNLSSIKYKEFGVHTLRNLVPPEPLVPTAPPLFSEPPLHSGPPFCSEPPSPSANNEVLDTLDTSTEAPPLPDRHYSIPRFVDRRDCYQPLLTESKPLPEAQKEEKKKKKKNKTKILK